MEEKDTDIWGATANSEDYSPSATLVHFDHPVPLLREPLPAGSSDDPSAGPFVLAFRDADSWKSAYRDTQAKITEQCLAGARVGCSISASKKCSPPWWKNLFGLAPVNFAERECCEEREMSACLVASKEQCTKFAKDKCLAPFRDARIASIDMKGVWNLSQSPPNGSDYLPQCNLEFTNYRGSVLLEDANSEPLY